jgi:hypothetical protein
MPIGDSPVGNLPNDPYIQKEFYEPNIYERVSRKIAPLIEWLPRVEADAEAIVAIRETHAASDDPKRRYPAIHVPGTEFPRVTVSGLEEISTVLAEEGLEFAISPRARRWSVNISQIESTYRRVSWWMADYLALKLFTNLKGFVTQAEGGMSWYDRSAVKWNAEGADPIKDLQLMKHDMEDFDMGFGVTDFYLHRTDFRRLVSFVTDLDVDLDTRRNMFGMPEPSAEQIYIPILGATCRMVKFGLDQGSVLALDANNRPATLYYGRNPEYGPAESWVGEDGEQLENDLGLHSHGYFDDRTHDEVRQLWFEQAVLVNEPMAGIYCPSGAKGV